MKINGIQMGGGLLSLAVLGCLLSPWVLTIPSQAVQRQWNQHLQECREIDLAVFKRDRARVVTGSVLDGSGQPIANATIRVMDNATMMQEGRKSLSSLLRTKLPVECKTQTDGQGKYRIEYLDVGAKTIFVDRLGYVPRSLPHRVIMEGYGSRIDVRMEKRPDELMKDWTFTPEVPFKRNTRLWFLSLDWCPEVSTCLVSGDNPVTCLDSQCPGGAGIVIAENEDASEWALCGVFQERSYQALPVPYVIPNDLSSQSLDAWSEDAKALIVEALQARFDSLGMQKTVWSNVRMQFWSSISPVCFLLATPQSDSSASTVSGVIAGFTGMPYSPVMCESFSGRGVTAYSNHASEFSIPVPETGAYRVRTMGWNGVATFSNGVFLAKNERVQTTFSRFATLDYEKDKPAQFSGFVKSSQGVCPNAKVVMQDAESFRYFLKTATCDEFGFFRFEEVPLGRRFIAFAIPDGMESPLRNFVNLATDRTLDNHVDLQLYLNRLLVAPPDRYAGELFLVTMDEPRIAWGGSVGKGDSVMLGNVPPGRYVLSSSSMLNELEQVSLCEPIVIDANGTVRNINWK